MTKSEVKSLAVRTANLMLENGDDINSIKDYIEEAYYDWTAREGRMTQDNIKYLRQLLMAAFIKKNPAKNRLTEIKHYVMQETAGPIFTDVLGIIEKYVPTILANLNTSGKEDKEVLITILDTLEKRLKDTRQYYIRRR